MQESSCARMGAEEGSEASAIEQLLGRRELGRRWGQTGQLGMSEKEVGNR